MMSVRVSIYALVDPRTRVTRYIGYTKHPLHVRLRQHVKEPWYGAPKRKFAWIEELRTLGLAPEILLLESVEVERAVEVERRWIEVALASGLDLLNNDSKLWPRRRLPR